MLCEEREEEGRDEGREGRGACTFPPMVHEILSEGEREGVVYRSGFGEVLAASTVAFISFSYLFPPHLKKSL